MKSVDDLCFFPLSTGEPKNTGKLGDCFALPAATFGDLLSLALWEIKRGEKNALPHRPLGFRRCFSANAVVKMLSPRQQPERRDSALKCPFRPRFYIHPISILYRSYIHPISILYPSYIEPISILYRRPWQGAPPRLAQAGRAGWRGWV